MLTCVWSLCSANKLLRHWHFLVSSTSNFCISWREGTARTLHILGHSTSGRQKGHFYAGLSATSLPADRQVTSHQLLSHLWRYHHRMAWYEVCRRYQLLPQVWRHCPVLVRWWRHFLLLSQTWLAVGQGMTSCWSRHGKLLVQAWQAVCRTAICWSKDVITICCLGSTFFFLADAHKEKWLL